MMNLLDALHERETHERAEDRRRHTELEQLRRDGHAPADPAERMAQGNGAPLASGVHIRRKPNPNCGNCGGSGVEYPGELCCECM